MTTDLKLVFSAFKGQFAQAVQALINPIAASCTGAIKDAAETVKANGRSHIRSAGFSARWANAFRVNVYPKRGNSVDAALFAYHKIPYAGVFETGATIAGNPYLWIPISGLPARLGGRRLTPKIFVQTIGPLHSVNIPGHPPMLAAYIVSNASTTAITVRKLKAGSKRVKERGLSSVKSVPIFYGINAVQLRGKFRMAEIFQSAKSSLPQLYLNNLKKVQNGSK